MDLLTKLFGMQVKFENWNKKDFLPLYIADSYDFQLALINGIHCIVITPSEELVTLPALKKQIKKIQEIDNLPVVINLPNISFYRKKNMLENKIPFITDKQVYLPFMVAYLSDEEETQVEVSRFMFSAQQLALLYLYSKEDKLYLSEATKKLPFTAMSLSRASKQLEATGLFNVTKEGVNKVVSSKYSRQDLFEKLKEYMSTPVRKSGYIEKNSISKDMVLSGESALSEETMLNPPRVMTYAVYAKMFDKKHLIDELVDPDRQVRLELWEYEPRQFGDDNIADKLSVVLSFKDTDDERIEEATEELLESVW